MKSAMPPSRLLSTSRYVREDMKRAISFIVGYLIVVVVLSLVSLVLDILWRAVIAGLLLLAIFPVIGYVHLWVAPIRRSRRAGVRVAIFLTYGLCGAFLLHDTHLDELIAPIVGRTRVLDAPPDPLSGMLFGLVSYAISLLASLFADRVLNAYRVILAGSRCAYCGYDLTGNVSGRCPECGTAIEAPSATAADEESAEEE